MCKSLTYPFSKFLASLLFLPNPARAASLSEVFNAPTGTINVLINFQANYASGIAANAIRGGTGDSLDVLDQVVGTGAIIEQWDLISELYADLWVGWFKGEWGRCNLKSIDRETVTTPEIERSAMFGQQLENGKAPVNDTSSKSDSRPPSFEIIKLDIVSEVRLRESMSLPGSLFNCGVMFMTALGDIRDYRYLWAFVMLANAMIELGVYGARWSCLNNRALRQSGHTRWSSPIHKQFRMMGRISMLGVTTAWAVAIGFMPQMGYGTTVGPLATWLMWLSIGWAASFWLVCLLAVIGVLDRRDWSVRTFRIVQFVGASLSTWAVRSMAYNCFMDSCPVKKE